ncbi:hypothetical protein PCANC_26274, partial [Puccinia coronata f. sp. avenae]
KDKRFTILSLRSDNCGEYLSNEITKYLADSGITHEPGPPHSPELNGVAERMNRTISNLVRSGFRSPSSILDMKPPDLKYLHPFGCMVWHKVPEANRKKLDVKGRSGMLLSYLKDGNGYRVWDLQRRVVVKTQDTLFKDDRFPMEPHSVPRLSQCLLNFPGRTSLCHPYGL